MAISSMEIYLVKRKNIFKKSGNNNNNNNNNEMLRIFEPKRDEVTGEWRKLHNEGLSDLYCSPNIFRVI
jgi:hypothetical protein